MKYLTIFILSLITMSCSKNESDISNSKDEISDFECIDTDKSINITTVNKYIYSRWKLGFLATMLPTEKTPDIEVEFKDVLGIPLSKQLVDIYIDKVLIGSVIYSLKENFIDGKTYTSFVDGQPYIGNTKEYNFIRGNIRICEDELIIDNGMAGDAPGYFFYKLK